MSGYDVAYIVRPGEDNQELRYSLRSLSNLPHGAVWIVGHLPTWVRGVRHLSVEQAAGAKYDNATANLRMLAARGPREFMLFNDDFYVTEPVTGPPAAAHRGPLLELADRCGGGYSEMLRTTHQFLSGRFHIPAPLAYTLHVPMLLNRDVLAAVLALADPGSPRMSWRSLYGNLEQLGGERQDDVKVHGAGPRPPGPWLSTSDGSFHYHPVGRWVRKRFPDPSPYEA